MFFFVISSIKLGNSNKIWYADSWINLLQSDINVLYLTWITSLHYLLRTRGTIGLSVVTWRNYGIYSTSAVADKFARFESSWLQRVGVLQEKMYKIHITDLNDKKEPLRTEWANWIMSLLRQPFVSGVVSSRSVMHVLYTFSCNISHMLLSAGFKCGEFGGHSWDG